MESGFLVVNKPIGPTSHDMVDKLRRISGIKKIGHAGTLDPFASGVLVLAVGRSATKRISEIAKTDKEYIADICLGVVTDTYDNTGKTVDKKDVSRPPKKEEIEGVLKSFIGKQKQTPPMYSAKKVGGKKLYQLARQGKEVAREPSLIDIKSIELMEYEFPELRIKVKCSSGTYLRSLAHDIGMALDVGAHLKNLKRTTVGSYNISQAVDLEEVNENNWSELLFQI